MRFRSHFCVQNYFLLSLRDVYAHAVKWFKMFKTQQVKVHHAADKNAVGRERNNKCKKKDTKKCGLHDQNPRKRAKSLAIIIERRYKKKKNESSK